MRTKNWGAGDEFCAIVNPKTTKSPWSFEDKSGSKEFLNGEFFEGGINLSLLGLGSECFGTVASETRASTSTSSTLQDFVLSNFAECKAENTTTPVSEGKAIPEEGLNIPTDPADASLKVQDKAELAVTGATSFKGTLSFHLCGPFEASSETVCDEGGVDLGYAESRSERNVRLRLGDGDVGGPLLLAGGFLELTTGVPASSDSSATECFIVNPATPEITTQAGEGPVDLGKPVTDTGTLTGTAHKPGTGGPTGSNGSINPQTLGGDATGKIAFTLYEVVLNGNQEPVCGEKANSNIGSEKNPRKWT